MQWCNRELMTFLSFSTKKKVRRNKRTLVFGFQHYLLLLSNKYMIYSAFAPVNHRVFSVASLVLFFSLHLLIQCQQN